MIFRISAPFRRDRAEAHELVEGELVLLELADRQRRAVDGERRRDDVDAGAVRQARVADRRGVVDPAADLADDALADVHQLLVVAEAHVGQLDLAVDLDEGAVGAVDHDVGDVVAGEQRLERAVAEHVVADVVEQFLLLGDRQDDVLEADDLRDDVADLLARRSRRRGARAARGRSPRSARRRSCSWCGSSPPSAAVSARRPAPARPCACAAGSPAPAPARSRARSPAAARSAPRGALPPTEHGTILGHGAAKRTCAAAPAAAVSAGEP